MHAQRSRLGRTASTLVSLALLVGCSPKPIGHPREEMRVQSDPLPPRAPAVRPFADLLEAYLMSRPENCRSLGLHAVCDGRIADYSEAGIQERIRMLETIRTELGAQREKLDADPTSKLDAELLDLTAQEEIFRLVDLEEWRRRPKFYEEIFGLDSYLVREYAPLDERAAAIVRHVEQSLTQTQHIKKNLRGPLPLAFVKTDIGIFKGHGEYLRGDVQTILSGVKDEALRAKAMDLTKKLAVEADAIAEWLEKSELPRGDQSHVLGRDRYVKLLRVQEALDTPLAELEKMAEADLARNKKAYEDLVQKGVKDPRPKAAELLDVARKLTADSRKFIEEKALVTIPEGGKIEVKESPPFMQWNAAFLNGPGPFDAPDLVAYYYITKPNPKWPKKEQEEYLMPRGTLLATSVHEVFPGHFMQGLWTRKAPSRAQMALQSYSFVEGWAHYTEQLMVDEGFRKDDSATKLGQLSDALLRNCRFVVSIGLHTKSMTLEEAEKRFVDDCKQDRAGAREQATRGTFDPGYFAYTLGKLQILELRDEAQKKLGPKFTMRAFHDAVLAHGGPPVPMLRPFVLRDLGIAENPVKTQ